MDCKDNESFTKEIMAAYPLDCAIDWIKSNMEPEDVFDEDKLSDWAESNGYTKETNDEQA